MLGQGWRKPEGRIRGSCWEQTDQHDNRGRGKAKSRTIEREASKAGSGLQAVNHTGVGVKL